jgi:hypothetical protein
MRFADTSVAAEFSPGLFLVRTPQPRAVEPSTVLGDRVLDLCASKYRLGHSVRPDDLPALGPNRPSLRIAEHSRHVTSDLEVFCFA